MLGFVWLNFVLVSCWMRMDLWEPTKFQSDWLRRARYLPYCTQWLEYCTLCTRIDLNRKKYVATKVVHMKFHINRRELWNIYFKCSHCQVKYVFVSHTLVIALWLGAIWETVFCCFFIFVFCLCQSCLRVAYFITRVSCKVSGSLCDDNNLTLKMSAFITSFFYVKKWT